MPSADQRPEEEKERPPSRPQRREEKRRRQRSRIVKHGASLRRIYRDAVIKRASPRRPAKDKK